MEVTRETPDAHLTDDALYALAVPPTGAPEPLPAHVLACVTCSRLLAEWKAALRDLGREDEDVIARRAPEEWRAAEDATLAAIRRAGAAGSGRARTIRWALPAAAALLLLAVFVGERRAPAPVAFDDTAGLSAKDRADDALLRDVDSLASGEEGAGGWNGLVPDPAADTAPASEEPS